MRLLHLSDLHFRGSTSKNRKRHAMLEYVSAEHPDAYLVITGDITESGETDQLQAAHNALLPFAERGCLFMCPGNHDFGKVGNFYSRKRAERYDAFFDEEPFSQGSYAGQNKPALHRLMDGEDRALLIGLDTNLETDDPTDFACGQVGEHQLAALKQLLTQERETDSTKILFFHHHPFMWGDWTMQLTDSRALLALIAGKIDVLLFGHKHDEHKWEDEWGVKQILAANNSPSHGTARVIEIIEGSIAIKRVEIK